MLSHKLRTAAGGGGYTPPSFVSYTYNLAPTSAPSIAKPANVVAGNVLLLFFFHRTKDISITTPPSGFTQLYDYNPGVSLGCLIKVAGSSEPSTYTWSFTAESVTQTTFVMVNMSGTFSGLSDGNGTPINDISLSNVVAAKGGITATHRGFIIAQAACADGPFNPMNNANSGWANIVNSTDAETSAFHLSWREAPVGTYNDINISGSSTTSKSKSGLQVHIY